MDHDVDVENGGGDKDAAILGSPNPADPQMTEKQPCTWLRAAPYMVAILGSVALIVAGLSLDRRSCLPGAAGGETTSIDANACRLAVVIAISGAILLFAAMFAVAVQQGECNPRFLPRFDETDSDDDDDY